MPRNTSEHSEENNDEPTNRRQGSIVQGTDRTAQGGRGSPDGADQKLACEKKQPARLGHVLAGDVTFNKEEKRDA